MLIIVTCFGPRNAKKNYHLTRTIGWPKNKEQIYLYCHILQVNYICRDLKLVRFC